MANIDPVVYSVSPTITIPRRYGLTTYSTMADPVSTTLTMAESVGSTDALADTLRKVLADMLTSTDSRVTAAMIKALTDSTTLSDMLVIAARLQLSDSLDSPRDALTRRVTKVIQDILLLQDWLSIRLTKANIWTQQIKVIATPTLYGQRMYGQPLYSGIGIPNIWNTTPVTPANSGWKSFNQLEPMD